jgi:putative DNA primase/helicase
MIDGCTKWQKDGLKQPAAVTAATEEYLEVEDVFASWLEECCKLDANAVEKPEELWVSWQSWAAKANEFVGTRRRFLEKLEDRGFKRDRAYLDGKQQRVHRGLSLW